MLINKSKISCSTLFLRVFTWYIFSNPIRYMVYDYMIRIENVVKKFNGETVLNGVNLEIREREIVVLLGPNGSGKTTLMKIIVGVLRPNEGRVLVYGKEPYVSLEVKGKIGYIPQEPLLFDNLTGYENYMFYASLHGVEKEAKERLENIKKILDIGEWFHKKLVKTYSGGMIRKTNIAVSLSHDPQLLVMDEPTVGLDPNARRSLWDIILRLKEQGKTMIIATHLFEDAEVLADRVIVMYKGRISRVGTVEELKNSIPYKFAIEIEFAAEPDGKILEAIKSCCDESKMLKIGFTYRLLTNDLSIVSTLEKKLSDVSPRLLKLEARRISLDDVYFLITGVRLK